MRRHEMVHYILGATINLKSALSSLDTRPRLPLYLAHNKGDQHLHMSVAHLA